MRSCGVFLYSYQLQPFEAICSVLSLRPTLYASTAPSRAGDAGLGADERKVASTAAAASASSSKAEVMDDQGVAEMDVDSDHKGPAAPAASSSSSSAAAAAASASVATLVGEPDSAEYYFVGTAFVLPEQSEPDQGTAARVL